MAWCRFFIPKIAAANINPDDPHLNEHIMYAKCIKGHVLKDANDWILCENLPAADGTCWMEGGDTLFSLAARKRSESKESPASNNNSRQATKKATPSGSRKA